MKRRTPLWGLWNIFLPASIITVCFLVVILQLLFVIFEVGDFPKMEITWTNLVSIFFGLIAIASSGGWLLLSIQKKKRAKIIFAGMSNCSL